MRIYYLLALAVISAALAFPAHALKWGGGNALSTDPGQSGSRTFDWNTTVTPSDALSTSCGIAKYDYYDDVLGSDTTASATIRACADIGTPAAQCTDITVTGDSSGTIDSTTPIIYVIPVSTGETTSKARVRVRCQSQFASNFTVTGETLISDVANYEGVAQLSASVEYQHIYVADDADGSNGWAIGSDSAAGLSPETAILSLDKMGDIITERPCGLVFHMEPGGLWNALADFGGCDVSSSDDCGIGDIGDTGAGVASGLSCSDTDALGVLITTDHANPARIDGTILRETDTIAFGGFGVADPGVVTAASHGFETGEAVMVNCADCATFVGASFKPGTVFYLEVLDADTFEVYTTRAGAVTAGGGLEITAQGSGNTEFIARKINGVGIFASNQASKGGWVVAENVQVVNIETDLCNATGDGGRILCSGMRDVNIQGDNNNLCTSHSASQMVCLDVSGSTKPDSTSGSPLAPIDTSKFTFISSGLIHAETPTTFTGGQFGIVINDDADATVIGPTFTFNTDGTGNPSCMDVNPLVVTDSPVFWMVRSGCDASTDVTGNSPTALRLQLSGTDCSAGACYGELHAYQSTFVSKADLMFGQSGVWPTNATGILVCKWCVWNETGSGNYIDINGAIPGNVDFTLDVLLDETGGGSVTFRTHDNQSLATISEWNTYLATGTGAAWTTGGSSSTIGDWDTLPYGNTQGLATGDDEVLAWNTAGGGKYTVPLPAAIPKFVFGTDFPITSAEFTANHYGF